MSAPELTPAQIVIELAVALATERSAHAQTRADNVAKIAQLSTVLERERGENRAFGDEIHALATRLVADVLDDSTDTWTSLREITLAIAERAGVILD